MVHDESHTIIPASFERFGDLLRHLRLRARLTQRALSTKVGCTFGQISRLESGKRLPDPAVVRAVFVPALGLADEPAWSGRLLILAEQAAWKSEDYYVGAPRRARPYPAGAEVTNTNFARTASVPSRNPLVATKIGVPQLRADLVSRPRLLQQLDAALTVPLTLVTAGAGFGKTTLLANWLHELHHRPASIRGESGSPLSVTWLSLDASDNELMLFVRYLVATLQVLLPNVGTTTLLMLQQPQLPALPLLLAPLVNDLMALPGPSLLVLDDYHLLTLPLLHEAVLFLIEHMPPALHIILVSRVDPPLPLARLRARRLLVEIRAADLRFTPDEAHAFLRETMRADVTSHQATVLEQRTEGWPAGLQLAALALRGRPDHDRFLASFTGNHRYVVDYLASEVIDELPFHLRAFLLHTAILDRFCAPLCDAVLAFVPAGDNGRAERTSPARATVGDDAYSRLILAELERMNLFVTPLDDERRWYRYHQLFVEALRVRLTQDVPRSVIVQLHTRASAWFADQGLIEEALHHALAADDLDGAARLIEQRAEALIIRTEMMTLRRWIERLPIEVIYRRRRLALAYAGVLLALGHIAAVEPLLQAAECAAPPEPLDPLPHTGSPSQGLADRGWLDDLAGSTAEMRSIVARANNDFTAATKYAQTALQLLAPHFVFMRSAALWNLGVVRWLEGDLVGAEAVFAQVWAHNQAPDQLYMFLVAALNRGQIRMARGQLHEATQLYQEALRHAAVLGEHVASQGLIHVGLAEVLREQNDLDEALRHIHHAITIGKQFNSPDVLVAASTVLAAIRLALRDELGARVALADVAQLTLGLVLNLDMSRWFRVLVALGEVATSEHWARSAETAHVVRGGITGEHRQIVLARTLLARGADTEALELLEPLAATSEAAGHTSALIEMLALQVRALHGRRAGAQADMVLERALRLAAPVGYVRLFVDEGMPMAQRLASALGRPEWGKAKGQGGQDVRAYAQQLLRQLAAEGHHVQPHIVEADRNPIGAGIERLTAREQEVLRLLANGQSNQAIADQLVLAIGTVKRHVNSVLSKLGVQSRLQAVVRARDLNLL